MRARAFVAAAFLVLGISALAPPVARAQLLQMVDVSFANSTDKWAVVTIGDANPSGPSAGRPPVRGECVPAGQTKTWKLVAAAEYIVNFYVREGSCTGRDIGINGGRVKVNGNVVNVRMGYGLDQTQ